MNRTASATHHTTAGFTLVEMLVGLAIIALAIGIAGVAFLGRQDQSNALEFARDIQFLSLQAHQNAMMSGTPRELIFDMERRLVLAEGDQVKLMIPENLTITLLTGLELIEENGRVPLIFFGGGGSTGIEVKIEDPRGRIARSRTNWLTGLTKVVTDASQH